MSVWDSETSFAMNEPNLFQRRQFLKQSAAGFGLLILPSGIISGKNSPNAKLNIALIGAGGRATAHFGAVSGENVVALCDVDENALTEAAKKFPEAKHYTDWRKCLEHKGLDAIVCATTDHTHAHVANWAMLRGLHVYCEKPLANSVEEARVVRATYLANKGKLATQVGTQRHAENNFKEVRNLIRDGAIGELREVSAWGNRQLPKPGYLPAEGEPPKHLNYDLWLGPSPAHPYNPGYFATKGPGTNCLNWNMYWDFGSGQVGDMGSHTMDLAWNAIDASLPTGAAATGDPFNTDITPVKLAAHFKIPANDWRPAIKLSWYQGGAMPQAPTETAFKGIGHGAMFTGSKGILIADFGSHVIIPNGTAADARLSRTGVKGGFNFQGEWLAACKGGPEPSCNFDYAGKMIEMMMLGLVAYRTGSEIVYDPAGGKVTGNETADALLRRKYRAGWPLVG
jgi:predicted dehydrogenase